MKKICFLTKSMNVGGVEKTLINLCKIMQEEQCTIDIILVKKEGTLLSQIPKYVTISELELPEILRDLLLNYGNDFTNLVKESLSKKRYFKCAFYYLIKICNRLAELFFNYNLLFGLAYLFTKTNLKEYDVICDYHGYAYFTTYFVAKESHKYSKKSFSWIHEENISKEYMYISNSYNIFYRIFGVSRECVCNFKKQFPFIDQEKVQVLHNIVFKEELLRKSNVPPEKEYHYPNKTFIVSVGRLSYQKGFDLALYCAKEMKQRGIEFFWLIIGDGEEKKALSELINKLELSDCVFLHGNSNNPYPYIKNAKIYVQTSRYEGFATTITEAVLLNKPVVSTKVSGVTEQVSNGKSGYIVDFDEKQLCDAIEKIIVDGELCNSFVKATESTNLDSANTIKKLVEYFGLAK